jgi:predicted dithiol-disulfide oxidoreductase (DUF899 family)
MPTSEIQRYPDGASSEYIEAREKLAQAEWDLSQQIEKVAALRRQLPPGVVMKDYTFETSNNTNVSLSDLSADGRSVVIYHLMFSDKDDEPCGMCGLFVDSLNGVALHLDQLVNFAVVAKGHTEKLDAYAQKRGWKNIKLLSSLNNTFNKDLKVEYPIYAPETYSMPGISVFKKDEAGKVRHFYSQGPHFEPFTQRGLDLLEPLYNVLDLVPEGRGSFLASNSYLSSDL